ncbi:unnamed protein product [Cuscuta campestris]|uniref:non-specific serine/threonine protein kinase n=1 Tax=Cuscuta campestris TaxID=132261 RepID=A0A484KTE7_9ASTE|nr:unnamed protein product [Cuscuta campestris]
MSSPIESPPSPDSSDSSPPPPSPPSNSSPPPPSPWTNSPPPPPPSPWKNSSPPPPPSPSPNSSPPPSPDSNQSSPPPSNSSPPPPDSSNPNPPPPPPHSPLPPAAKHKSSSSSSHRSSSDNALSDSQKAVIAGVAAGAGLLLLILIVFLISCCCRRRKRRPRGQIHYYSNGHEGGANYYGGPNGNWHNNVHSGEHMVKMPPPPPGPPSGAVSSEYGWPIAPPPPPPPMMSSGEMNSAAFSGQHQPAAAATQPPPPPMSLGFNQSSFTYNDLAAATGGFSQSNLLGQGGFGYVHKGVLPNGKEVAVKSLKSNSGQGEREFQAEVEIISRVHHRHLVSLVGYCIAGQQRMLVYEFVPNGTLEFHLHGKGRPVMDFQTRLKIALGSAKGFAYLHEDCHPRIIHRDIKAANILLDNNFEAMVADFGLAKLSSDNYTHVSTRIMGTFGYLAPEYASTGKLTDKSDVYSYGVMLLELITGRRPVDVNSDEDDSLVDWARPILMRAAEGGSYEELVDPRLENNYDHQEMNRMVACAGASIRHSARRRPKMSQIVRALEGDVSLEDLNNTAAVKSQTSSAATFSSGGSSEFDGNPYDMKRFRKSDLLSSQELTMSSGEQ